jgi:quercetin dioxygenase-like cupin family protein
MDEITIYRGTSCSYRRMSGGRDVGCVTQKGYADLLLEPDTIFPEHSHDEEQITLVLKEELFFSYDGKTVALKAGDVIAIPSNAVHAAYTDTTSCMGVDAWSPVRKKFL